MTHINSNDEWRVAGDAADELLHDVEQVARDLAEHDIIKPSDPHAHDEEANRAICDGGLAICRRCGKVEVELDEPCVPRRLSSIHDSDTCTLGPNDTPCDMCVAADEYERRQRQSEPVTTTQQPLWADAATVRAAIFDVVDAGAPSGWWELYDDGSSPEATEDMVNQERCEFADAVLARMAQLQQPPHSFPRLEVLCPTHIRWRLPSYSGWCADCAKERER